MWIWLTSINFLLVVVDVVVGVDDDGDDDVTFSFVVKSDPHHHELYLKWNEFLPILNNETYHTNSTGTQCRSLCVDQSEFVCLPVSPLCGPSV